jgi:hypothetical protein
MGDTSGCNGSLPSGLSGENATYQPQGMPYYFLVMNDTVWLKQGDCNFTGETVNYTQGQQMNVTRGGKTYMLYMLYANSTPSPDQGIVLGVPGIDTSTIMPIRVETMNGQSMSIWKLMAMTLGGVNYSVLLANDTYDYPMCSVWNTDCTKKAWFSMSGAFDQPCNSTECGPNATNAVGAAIGQNFTGDLYIAKIGPGPWDGIIIANFTNLISMYPSLPLFDVKTAESRVIYFAALDEGAIGMDLDLNDSTSNTYYVMAFDDREDGAQNMTSLKIDDDVEITDDFWGDYSEPQSPAYKDFSTDELNSMRESWRNLPNSIYKGSIMFGSDTAYENASYESRPEWEIVAYNNTDMLIQKKRWLNVPTDHITVISKVYNFDQSPIAGANISISKITKFTNFGPQALSLVTDYNVTQIQNVTDSYGYGILEAWPVQSPPSGWDLGEYMITLSIQGPMVNQTSYQWFRVEPAEGGPV